MSKGLTRREFVKGTVAGTAVLAFAGSPLFSTWAAEPVKRGGVWRYARNRTTPEPGRPPGQRDLHRHRGNVRLHRRCVHRSEDLRVQTGPRPGHRVAHGEERQAADPHPPQGGPVPRRQQVRRGGGQVEHRPAAPPSQIVPRHGPQGDRERRCAERSDDRPQPEIPLGGADLYPLHRPGPGGLRLEELPGKERRRRAGPQGLRHRGIPLEELDRRREGRPGAVSRLLEEGGRRQAAPLPRRDGGALPAEDRPGGARPPVRRAGHRPFSSAPRGCPDQGEPGPALYGDAPLRVPGRLLRIQPAQGARSPAWSCAAPAATRSTGSALPRSPVSASPAPTSTPTSPRGSPAGRPRTGPITPTTPRRPRSW